MMRWACLQGAGPVFALALIFAPICAEAAVTCPDSATVQAARVVEFQTMMMGVSVRCKHVGVVISDHLDQMTTARRTMLTSANDRVAAYLRSNVGAPTLPPAAAQPPAPAPAPAKSSSATYRAQQAKPAASARTARKAAAVQAKPAATSAAVSPPAAAPVPKSAAGKARSAAAAAATPPAKPAARISRRTDPFDRYLTMIGNQYGGGMTTLQRCKAFDAIVVSLADRTNTDRLMTMVSQSLVQVTLLEAIVNCPPGKP